MSDAGERTIVVGSGPCGAAAAQRLVERGIPTTVLDAGSGAPGGLIIRAAGNTMFRKTDWSMYQTDRLTDASADRVAWYSSRSLGGLSNYWTAAVPRFAPDDFTDGERLDERFRWPIGYDELAPYYELAERQLNVTAGGEIPGLPSNVASHRHDPPPDWREVAESCAKGGSGFGPIPMAKGDPWMVASRPTEFSSYHCVLQPLESNPLLELRRNTRVTKLIWSPEESRVTAVECIDTESGQTFEVQAANVVLAAGAVDSTMILLRSTSSDFPTGLGNTNDVLGRYLHDHPREWWPATLDRPMRALHHPMYLVREAHAETKPIYATSHTVGLLRPTHRLRTYVRARVDDIGVQVFGTMVPDPEFRITLDDDPMSDRATIALAYDGETTDTIERSRERFQDVMADAGLGIGLPGPYHDLTPGESVHFAGSVRMHDNPHFGVLDRWNRIHDAQNVVVCDLSSFTTSPEKNPTLTAMALAIRAADRLSDGRQTSTTKP